MARTVPEGIVGYSALQTIWSAFINYVDLHIRSKHGNGAPTTTTEGKIQQFYIDDINQKIYRCTAVNENSYTWTAITATDPNAASHIANETIHVTNTQKNDWNNKQNNISDLESIRSGAALGATALQSAPVTSVNHKTGAILLTASDVGALPSSTVIPAAPGELITNATTAQTASSGQSMSGNITLHKISKTGNYNDLLNKPTIPSAVTESTVSGWGFTKNTGTYSKPSDGIPKSDFVSAVQVSLDKADSAVQPSSLAGVATSGDYNDLSNKPVPYSLPVATADILGGIKVGLGLAINNGVLSATGGASTKEVITLPITDWGGTTAPYTKTVTLNGITANDYPIIDLISSASYDTAMYEKQSWGDVYRIVPSTNSLTFYSQSIPVVPLDLQVQYLKNATSSESVIYTTTLNTTWTGSSAPYTKTQTVNGILATDAPIIDIVPSSTYETAIKEEEFWFGIYRVVVASNSLTFYAKEKPTVALNLKIQCIRSN